MLLDADFEYINQAFEAEHITPAQLDILLANGWRHFGTHFFRYNLGFHGFDIERVTPLRIRLSEFSFSKSQRRILRRNNDLDVLIRPFDIDAESEGLFERHKQRFKENTPDSIHDFLPNSVDASPCEANELRVLKNGELVAASYFDVGERTASGVYGIFEPTESRRSLGIFTMLKEIEYAIETGKEFYYQGYAYQGESFYDYKKRFHGTEAFDWANGWIKFTEETRSRREDEK